MTKAKKYRRIRFTSSGGWKLAVTIGPKRDGGFGICAIGKQHHETRPLDLAPFRILDAGVNSVAFPTMEEAENHARSL